MRAFWNYYLTVNLFNLAACAIIAFVSGLIWFPVVFCSFGLLAGISAFNFYFKQQYYFYHNLGYTKTRLNITTLCLNAVIGLPLFILLLFLV